MKASKLLMGIPTLLCAMLFVSSAFADAITVDNPSFETLPAGGLPFPCGTDCSYSVDAIPGWTNSGSGQFQPGPPATMTYFDSVPDGHTVAYSNGGTISQTVGATVQDGVTYTLTVDIGARNDFPFAGSADLMFGDTVCNTATGTPPPLGNWSVYTATCTGTLGEAGDPITIQLNSSGAQGDFDSVVLTDSVSSIPEPSTLTLFGSGLLAMAYLVRRKRLAQS
jgi:hypothetical protein